MSQVIGKDTDLRLPRIVVVEASAGSGKTRALTLRLAQFLLSRSIPHNGLPNILAITFTNNAALEMKQRILGLLQRSALGHHDEAVVALRDLVSLPENEFRSRAGAIVEEILDRYSEFQIQTIDSFLARVFRASALEFGFGPGFRVVLDSRPLLDEAFGLVAAEVTAGSDHAVMLNQLADKLREVKTSRGKFQWNSYGNLRSEVKRLYSRIISTARPLSRTDFSGEFRSKGNSLCNAIEELGQLIDGLPLEPAARFRKYRSEAQKRHLDRLLELQFPDPPVVKGKAPGAEFRRITETIQPLCRKIAETRRDLQVLHARAYFQPYLETHRLLQNAVDSVRRRRGEVDLGDLILKLAQFVETGAVPEVYVSLGERMYHYLIDEFQDTAPIQWKTLHPLIDNSLSVGGSLFVVGDTKQSIYGFRGADWRIMKSLAGAGEFASAPTDVVAMGMNYRSAGRILDFVRSVFQENVPLRVMNGAERVSGLATFSQHVPGPLKSAGYVESTVMTGDTDERPERDEILRVVADCLHRGYRLRDIAILTPENEDVVKISGWLNEAGHAFIPFSTLDIRSRKVVGELIMLLRFLDSPLDDVAFGTFILGKVFQARLRKDEANQDQMMIRSVVFEHRRGNKRRPLYIAFREAHPDLWEKHFAPLFGLTGYLPLYDLIAHVYKVLEVFSLFPDEEAAWVKLLEVICAFEQEGRNSLKEFVGFAEEISEDSDWNIEIPPDVNAVRVMTVHKAKGLGFPVVIVLLYDGSLRSDGIYLEETQDAVRIVRLVKKDKVAADSPLISLFEDKELKGRVDQLNKLYVAFTRASEEMYVVGVTYGKSDEPSVFFPAGKFGERRPQVHPKDAGVETMALEGYYAAPPRSEKVERPERIHAEETRRGEAVHRILAGLLFIDGSPDVEIGPSIEKEDLRSGGSLNASSIRDTLSSFLSSPHVAPLFKKERDRRILNECEFVRSDGQLFRIDRLIMDPDLLTVVDFKTGVERPEHADQVRNYMSMVGDVFPGRPVRGIIAYVDLKTVRTLTYEGRWQ